MQDDRVMVEPGRVGDMGLGCDGGQGYLFARPLTPWDVEALLRQSRPRVVIA